MAKEISTEQSLDQEILAVETRRFTDRLQNMFSVEIMRNAVGFKKLVLRFVRRALPPRPGRRNDPQIDAAIQLLQQGKTVRDVLQRQIPDFEKMDSYARILADRGLRSLLQLAGFGFEKVKPSGLTARKTPAFPRVLSTRLKEARFQFLLRLDTPKLVRDFGGIHTPRRCCSISTRKSI